MAFLRIRPRLWQFALLLVVAAAFAAWSIRRNNPLNPGRTRESAQYWEAVDRELVEYLRLREIYDARLTELKADELNAWTLAAPERKEMELQQKRWADAYDKATAISAH